MLHLSQLLPSAVFFVRTSTGSGILYFDSIFELLLNCVIIIIVMDSLLCNIKPARAMDTHNVKQAS